VILRIRRLRRSFREFMAALHSLPLHSLPPPNQGKYIFDNHKTQYQVLGVPTNMGIHWRLLNSLRSMQHFFMMKMIAVFQLNHITSKIHGLKIFKMWSTIFFLQNWRRYCTNFIYLNILSIKIVLISNIFVNLEDTRKVNHVMKSSSDVQPRFYFFCHALNIRN